MINYELLISRITYFSFEKKSANRIRTRRQSVRAIKHRSRAEQNTAAKQASIILRAIQILEQ
jgi:hypothetical protein